MHKKNAHLYSHLNSEYCRYGEEKGWRCKEESSDYVWVLDPIDGTKSFITGALLVLIVVIF